MIDFIKRFLSSRRGKLRSAFQNVLEADGFYEEIDNLDDFDNHDLAKQSYMRNETLRLFRQKGQAFYAYSFAVMRKATTPLYYLVHMANNPSALREMKFTLWKHNTIDLMYQFQYGVYGLGFRTIDHYEKCKGQIFNIEESNTQMCIENLNDSLMRLIYNSDNGISLSDLHNQTMQMNPATWDHYQSYIRQQREKQELEVVRKEGITLARDLRPTDKVRKPKQRSLFLLKKKI
jgi:hypothetical protein